MTTSSNPYTSQSISGYNSSPPPDDGSTGADNLVTWAKHKTKLGDPIKTLAENINSQTSAAFAKVINTDASVRNSVAGSVAYSWATATIGDSIVTPLSSAAFLSGATTDTVFEIKTSNVYDGAILTLKTLSASDSITLVHATATGAATATAANIYLGQQSNITLDSQYDVITLEYDSTVASGWIDKSYNSGISAVSTTSSIQLPKAMVKFDGSAGTLAAATEYNVTSLTDNGTGDYTVTWTTEFAATDYVVVSGGGKTDASAGGVVRIVHLEDGSQNCSWATGSLRFRTGGRGGDGTNNFADITDISIVAYGAQ